MFQFLLSASFRLLSMGIAILAALINLEPSRSAYAQAMGDAVRPSKQAAPVELSLGLQSAGPDKVVIAEYEMKITAKRPLIDLYVIFNETSPTGDSSGPRRRLGALNVGEAHVLKGSFVVPAGRLGRIKTGLFDALTAQFRSQLPVTLTFDSRARELSLELPAKDLPSTDLLGTEFTITRTETTNGFIGTMRAVMRQPQNDPPIRMSVETQGLVTTFEGDVRSAAPEAANPIYFAIPASNSGVVIAEAARRDDQGNPSFVRRSELYLLATDRRLYSSTISPTETELAKLSDDYASQSISANEYNLAVQRIKEGGAKQSIE